MTLAILPIDFLFPKHLCKLERNIIIRRNVAARRHTTTFESILDWMPYDDLRRRSRSTVSAAELSNQRDSANEVARSKSQSREARPIKDHNNNNENDTISMRYLETTSVECDNATASHWNDETDEQEATRERGELRGIRSASFPAIPDNPRRKLSRSCMSVPDVSCQGGRRNDNNNQLPHLYTPYFYLPHHTSYENDQDLVIIKQPLDEMFLRANYFELKQLARAGFDFRTSDIHGNTPLHYAAKRGDTNIVRLVMSEGGSAWARNLDHRTPFELASNLATAMLLADSTLFYGQKGGKGHLEKIKVCYEL